jgi:predicted MFS family arabinose efflux permease
VLLAALVVCEVMFFSALAPLLPHYARQLHLSKSAAGLLSASYAIGTLVFAIPAGILVARIGARRATIASATLLAGASVAFGLSRSVQALDTARLLQGTAGSGVWAGSLTWLAGSTPAERRGEAVGAILGIGIAGALLGPVIGSVSELTDPRAVFGAVALLIFALAALSAATPEPLEAHGTAAGGVLRALRGDPRLLAGMWFTGLSAALFGVLGVLAPLRLGALGAGAGVIGGVFLVSAGLEAVASRLCGRITDRVGPLAVLGVGLGGSAAVAVALPLPDSIVLVALTTVAAGACFGISWVPASVLLSAGADREGLHQGLAYALWNLAWAIGVAVGAAGGAPLAQLSSDALPYWALAAVCLATLLLSRSRLRARLTFQ